MLGLLPLFHRSNPLVKFTAMNSDLFTNIKIVDLHVNATQPSDAASGLRHMYLRLSARPPSEWQEFFDQQRQFPRHNMWREAWIEGNSIVVDCVPEEIEQYHLRDLKEDVANTNKNYRDYLARIAREREQQKQADQEEKSRLEDLKGRLKFD
jgi:hypothetical protein